MKRRIAQLPLHSGKAPAWLFRRMTQLAGAITMAIVEEFGPGEMIRRLADPWWFQAFGCILGFDWHSSGLTTVTCGALKEAAKKHGNDLGIFVAGGKGAASRKTPQEIAAAADRLSISGGDDLIHASRMSAKVDSAAVQDGYDLYHHAFFFTATGAWCVVQQGMQAEGPWARRYHWLGEHVKDFVCEPHAAIQNLSTQTSGPQSRQLTLLNMVAQEADPSRRASVDLVHERPDWLLHELQKATEGPTLFAPRRHPLLDLDVNVPRLRKIVTSVHEQHPADFATLLGIAGVGPATVRSLALLAEIIFKAPVSQRDPAASSPLVLDSPSQQRPWADYAHAHGGKDGTPFPVDRSTYDRNISVLCEAVRRAKLGDHDRMEALKRLSRWERSSPNE
jgi:hypothetical protein